MKVYKTRTRKENPGIVLIYVPESLTEGEHNFLEKLRENRSDLFFIFSKSIVNEINPEKFSNLYEATWYGISNTDDRVCGFWEALDYITEFEKYTSISVITNYWSVNIDSLKKLQQSGIENSVFSSRKLTRKEKEDIYKIPETIIEILGKFRLRIPKKRNNLEGTNSTKTSDDGIFFLRPSMIMELKDDINPKILHSFLGSKFGTFISSVIPEKYHLNLKVNETKV